MKWLKVGLVSFLIVVVGLFVNTTGRPADAHPDALTGPCTISVSGTVATIVCEGIKVGTVQLPTVRITETAPPLPAVTDIVKIPGGTKTKFIKVPGPTKTVTVHVNKAGKTVTKNSSPHVKTGTRQPSTTRGTLGPATPVTPPPSHGIDFGDGRTTVIEAGIGIVATLALIGLLLAMYYAGYTFGFREADSKNAKYIKDVLDENA
jgi:hypothetical protein